MGLYAFPKFNYVVYKHGENGDFIVNKYNSTKPYGPDASEIQKDGHWTIYADAHSDYAGDQVLCDIREGYYFLWNDSTALGMSEDAFRNNYAYGTLFGE